MAEAPGVLAGMRALVFAPQFAPFANPEAFVGNKLALALLDVGCGIAVISRGYGGVVPYDYGSGWFEPWLGLRDVTREISCPRGSQVARLVDTVRAAAFTGHLVDGCRWAARAVREGLRLHRERPFDVVLSRAVPDAAHLAALAFAGRTGLPWVANWNDPPAVPRLVGGPPAKAPSVRQLRFLREVAARAGWHTFPCERMRSWVCGLLDVDLAGRSSVVPHIASGAVPRAARERGVFTVCHAGNLYPPRLTVTFLDALARFTGAGAAAGRVRVDVLGVDGVGMAEEARRRGLGGVVRFAGRLGYAESLAACAASDVLLVVEAPYVEGVFLPAKLADYAQAGRPILALSPPVGTVHDLLSAHGGGIAVDGASGEAIHGALRTLFAAWEEGTLDNRFDPGALRRLFSPEAAVASVAGIFRSIGVREGRP